MNVFRAELEQNGLPIPVYFEGDEEISTTVKKFQQSVQSVLCSYHLWEGLDVPGESLNNVVIYNLPYPPNDPVFKAKRQAAENPFEEVDRPYMLLRLRQGIGRLIRTSTDQGKIQLFMDKDTGRSVVQSVLDVLPVKPDII